MFKNKTLLITGGTGSFGNAVLSKFISSDIGEIRIFSRDEKKQHDMRVTYDNPKLKFYIGDVRDYQSILEASRDIDYIFQSIQMKNYHSYFY
jgi:UDP-glucose 4-epimerase